MSFHITCFAIIFKEMHILVFISITFITNARLKLAKNQVNAKQRLEAELLLFENHSNSSSTLSSKNNRTYSKNKQKNIMSVFILYE